MKNCAFIPVLRRSLFHFWAAIICLFLSTTATYAQTQTCFRWVLRTDVGSPGPRYGHSMAYDADRGVTYVFGGESSVPGDDPVFYNDVWEYDGKQWKLVLITSGPQQPFPRAYATIIPFNERTPDGTLVYGFRIGRGIGYLDAGGDLEELRDNWIFRTTGDGTGSWIRGPADYTWYPRGSLGTGGLLQAGGVGIGEVYYSSVSGGLPFGLIDHQAMQVMRNSELILLILGGGRAAETKPIELLDNPSDPLPGAIIETARIGGAWQKLSVGPQPFNRFQHVAAYDSDRQRVVMFGGYATDSAERHWELKIPKEGGTTYPANDITWQRMEGVGLIPQERAFAGMVYDSRRKVMVLFGGVGGTRYGDTWELVAVPPQITGLDRETCLGTPVTLAPTITGSGELRRQWYYYDVLPSGFSRWVTLIGETNLTLTVNPSTPGGHSYRLEVRDACDNVSEKEFRVMVHKEPSVTRFFQRQEFCPGASTVLDTEVFSTLPFTVQWYQDGKPIGEVRRYDTPGVEFEHLELNNLTRSETGTYSVVARNECGATTNVQFKLDNPNGGAAYQTGRLQVGPSIEKEPESSVRPVCSGSPSLFSVSADGKLQLSYQWRLDGKPLANGADFAGVDTSHLSIRRPLLYKDEGDYDVIVRDECGKQYAVTSRVATLTITPGPEWAFRTTNGPPARFQHSMAYDSARRVSVMFGGYFNTPTTFGTYNDLWEWNGARWAQRLPQSSSTGWRLDASTGRWRLTYADRPVARAEHAMTYDLRRGRSVIFGGTAVDPGGSLQYLNDTWEWDGAQWYFRGTNGPAWRSSAAMTYNSNHETAVLFGGHQSSADPAINVLWQWDGAVWKTNDTVNNPTRGGTAAMAYDSFHDVTLFGPTTGFSGIIHDIFWTLKEKNWTAKDLVFNINEVTSAYGDMVFNSYTRRSVYTFGIKGSTGFWNGRQWVVHSKTPAPQLRSWHATAYDSARHSVPLFGGTFGFINSVYVNTNDTWELIAVDTPLINEQPASQYRQANEIATFNVAAVGPPGLPLKYQWFRDNVPLESKGRVAGATGETLFVGAVQAADAGKYTVRVSCDCGDTMSLPAVLTLNPNLQIFTGAGTATLIWSDPKVVLEQADSPSGPWLAVPNATSPFSPAAVGPAKFFRLRSTQ